MSKNKVSKMNILLHLIVKIKKDDIFAIAAQLAYYLVLSFFPFLMFLFTLIGASNLDSTVVLDAFRTILPVSVYELVESIVMEVLGSQKTGLLGFSLLISVWTASSGARAILKGVNKAYNVHEGRTYIKRVIIAYVSIIVLAITVLLTLALLVFGELISKHIIDILPFREVGILIWNILRYGVILVIMIVIFAIIYKYAPSKKQKFIDVLPGAIIATLGWLVISVVFAYYINNYSNYSRFYGSLAAVFILMIWLFLTGLIFMFGVEVNSVLAINKRIRK